MAISEPRAIPVAPPSAPVRRQPRGRGLLRGGLIALNYLALPVAILVLWQVAVAIGWPRKNLLPTPWQVISTWTDWLFAASGEPGRYVGTWWRHTSASATRVLIGFAYATVAGVSSGILIGLSRPFERFLDPTVQILRNIPITAWVPFSIIFFGIADQPAIALIALGAFFPIVINTTQGVKQVNRLLVRAGLMMGAGRWQLIRRIIFPAALPSIFTGLRLGMGIAWVLVVVSELVAVKSGLGFVLNDAYQFNRTDVMLAAMFTIGLLGFLFDRVILLVRRFALAWNRLETLNG